MALDWKNRKNNKPVDAREPLWFAITRPSPSAEASKKKNPLAGDLEQYGASVFCSFCTHRFEKHFQPSTH